jgi:glycosyltransferase involved in cell wall biosynthesis
MSEILVSVCCSTFNHEKFITKALDGFLMQKTNFKIEILINDDCSEDNTVSILKEYNKLYPGFFDITFQSENQFSKGVKPFAQMLFPRVKGKYIALCEGDDFWTDPDKLQKQVDFLEKNQDYSVCFHKCKIVDENNLEFDSETFYHLEPKDYVGSELLEKWSVPTASVMFRSEFINQIQKRAKTPGYLYGDTPMFLTLLENGKARCLADIMSAYRIHSGGISRIKSKKHIIALYTHYQTLKRDFNGKYGKIMAKNIGGHAFGASAFLFKEGHLLKGAKFLFISVFYDRKPVADFFARKFFKGFNSTSIN